MLRRDFVRAVVSVGLAPQVLLSQQTSGPAPSLPAPVPWTLGLNPKTPLPHTEGIDAIGQPEQMFFTTLQMAVLSRLCDVLMPPFGGKPGALQARTPFFLDFLIGESPSARKKLYTTGLNWLNEEALRRFKSPFAGLNNAQLDAILKPWLRTWMSDHPPLDVHADFINVAHHDIRSATINSKDWGDAPTVGAEEKTAIDLYWMPIEPESYSRSTSRPQVAAHVRASAGAAHPMPVYSR
jgi:hypothetical protein